MALSPARAHGSTPDPRTATADGRSGKSGGSPAPHRAGAGAGRGAARPGTGPAGSTPWTITAIGVRPRRQRALLARAALEAPRTPGALALRAAGREPRRLHRQRAAASTSCAARAAADVDGRLDAQSSARAGAPSSALDRADTETGDRRPAASLGAPRRSRSCAAEALPKSSCDALALRLRRLARAGVTAPCCRGRRADRVRAAAQDGGATPPCGCAARRRERPARRGAGFGSRHQPAGDPRPVHGRDGIEVVAVGSDKPDAMALQRAAGAGNRDRGVRRRRLPGPRGARRRDRRLARGAGGRAGGARRLHAAAVGRVHRPRSPGG